MPCLMRLVASSVATIATRPASSSPKPSPCATATAPRRASATWDWSRTAIARIASAPPRNDDTRAVTDDGANLEFVGEALGTAQTQTQTPARGIAVRQGEIDVRDARTLVLEGEAQAFAGTV